MPLFGVPSFEQKIDFRVSFLVNKTLGSHKFWGVILEKK